ncbi:MAG: hypothetical protein KAZ48_10960, partial [Candidatus Nanopelagicales bacterium]|nr:hypothetical protein [Candidatus Nanopelagicales bacterium]
MTSAANDPGRRHPARAARIATAGLSATAVLGLTAAYAVAAPGQDTAASVNGSAVTGQDGSVVVPAALPGADAAARAAKSKARAEARAAKRKAA